MKDMGANEEIGAKWSDLATSLKWLAQETALSGRFMAPIPR